jgi:hypothetical protein
MRPVKSGNKGIGGGQAASGKVLKRTSRLRPVSKKQRKRTSEWQKKFQLYLLEQVRTFGTTYCEMGQVHDKPCWGVLEPDHIRPRARRGVDMDSFKNMQGICTGHHRIKTDTPGLGDKDYRRKSMVEACEALDQLERVKNGTHKV